MLLQVVNPERVLDRGFNVAPDNVLGFLIMVLLLIIMALAWYAWQMEKKANKAQDDLVAMAQKMAEAEKKDLHLHISSHFQNLKEYLQMLLAK